MKCREKVHDPDGTRYRCVLPADHFGWHLDEFRMVDADGRRLPCEIRWSKGTYAAIVGQVPKYEPER